MENDEFRRRGHQLIDWLADYRASVEQRPVMAQSAPGGLKAALPPAPPQAGEPCEALLGRQRVA
jgi:hypothetical protein